MSQRTFQIYVARRPRGPLSAEDFARREADLPPLNEGEVLLRNLVTSVDGANRAYLNGRTYRPQVQVGEVFPAYAVAEVVQTRAASLAVGDRVVAEVGWQTFCILPASSLFKAPPVEPPSHLLSVFGVAGLTAYHGLVNVAAAEAGETVLVSAAAGGVGSHVGQLAKIQGCRAVGIAGGAAKCDWAVRELGYDVCLDYRAPDLAGAIAAACPAGVEVYFDNVGGKVTEAALKSMAPRGRIALCGAISGYDGDVQVVDVLNAAILKQLRMEGFLVSDLFAKPGRAFTDIAGWVASGQLTAHEDVLDGLDALPSALVGLLAGDNFGKRLVRVAEAR